MENINFKLQHKYILDDEELSIKLKHLIEENKIVLLVSPQGTGKSEFLKKLEFKKFLVSPTVATAEQVEKTEGFNNQRGRFYSTFRMSGQDRFGNAIERDYSSTFSSSKGIVNVSIVEEFDLLIVDEVHKIVQYSDFAYDQVISIIKTVNEFIRQDKKVILTTATPQLLKCLSQERFYNQIDIRVDIECERNYISECIIIDKLDKQDNIISLIKENANEGNFQIALINNKEKILDIQDKLKNYGIQSLSVNGQEYRDNLDGKAFLVKKFQQGIYEGYQVLLATSWIDVGLNFIGNNISALYCVFDDYYKTGDFTIIQQFIARTRNSTPKLYINQPKLSRDEQTLIENYRLNSNFEDYLYLIDEFKEVAYYIIERFSKGLIRDINVKNFYGIYRNQYHHNERKEMYKFSNITINYQLTQLYDKVNYNKKYIFEHILNCQNVKMLHIEEILSYDLIIVKNYLQSLCTRGSYFTKEEFCESIQTLTYGRYNTRQPTRFINTNFNGIFKITSKQVRIDGIRRNVFFLEKI